MSEHHSPFAPLEDEARQLDASIQNWFPSGHAQQGRGVEFPLTIDVDEEGMIDALQGIMKTKGERLTLTQWLQLFSGYKAAQEEYVVFREELVPCLWAKAWTKEGYLCCYMMAHYLVEYLQRGIDSTQGNASEQKQHFLEATARYFCRKKVDGFKFQSNSLMCMVFEIFSVENISLHNVARSLLIYGTKHYATAPVRLLRKYKLPYNGKLTNKINDLLAENLLRVSWEDWNSIKLSLELIRRSSDETSYKQHINEILSQVDDAKVTLVQDKIYQKFCDEFGHPLSVDSNWRGISQEVQLRIQSWGSRSTYNDYKTVHDYLEETGYYENLNQLNAMDNYSETTRAESRFVFWSQYKSQFDFVRIYLSPPAYEWMGKRTRGKELLRNMGLGLILGQKEREASNICALLIKNLLIIEFFSGSSNDAIFFPKAFFEEHQELFCTEKFSLEHLLRSGHVHKLKHRYEWQPKCEEWLRINCHIAKDIRVNAKKTSHQSRKR